MYTFIKEKSRIFYSEIITSKLFLVIVFLFIIYKFISNKIMGTSTFTALRSGILGILLYLAGLYIISLFSTKEDKTRKIFDIDYKVAKLGFIVSSIYFVFLITCTVDSLQRKEIFYGKPVLSYIPGYSWLMTFISNISLSVSNIAYFAETYQIENIIRGSIFYIFIPFIIFKLLGYKFKHLFSFKNTRASWPFLLIYLIIFLVSGLNTSRMWGLVYCILYPALCEEFLHRGIIYRSAASIFNNTAKGLILGTLFFSLGHFPDYYYRIYEGNILLTFGQMLSVFFNGILWTYGFRKTGTLVPWIIIHALSNILVL